METKEAEVAAWFEIRYVSPMHELIVKTWCYIMRNRVVTTEQKLRTGFKTHHVMETCNERESQWDMFPNMEM